MIRRKQAPASVSVNERLARLSSNELLDLAESSLVHAGRELLHSRGTGGQLGQQRFYLEQCEMHARQAYEALQVLLSRDAS